jgi:hypothetical protein
MNNNNISRDKYKIILLKPIEVNIGISKRIIWILNKILKKIIKI